MGEVTRMRYWDIGRMDDGWGVVMLLGMLSTWTLVAVAIVWIIRSTRTPTVTPTVPTCTTPDAPASSSVTASAEQILAERLARGDIDPEEYKTRLNALTSRRPL
jgi:putative membrane protein